MPDQIREIELDLIQPHPDNRRVGGYREDGLAQLAASIRAIGVHQPAVVRPLAEGRYEIVAGHRRWLASRQAGRTTLPCVVRELDDAKALQVRIVENLQREDVHPLDEAGGYESLQKIAGFEVQEIAEAVGKPIGYVYQRLRLLSLVVRGQKLFAAGRIQLAHALLIARLGDEQQHAVLDFIEGREESITARQLDEWIKRELFRQLSQATWRLNDKTLVVAAGACDACAKRTGAAPELFEEVDAKRDCCLDSECWEHKMKAILERRKKELADKPHLLVSEAYSPQKGALGRYDWRECKKKDEGAVQVLIVDGASAGRLTWGIQTRKSGKEVLSAEEKAEKLRAKKLEQAREAACWRIIEESLKPAAGKAGPSATLLLIVARRVWSTLYGPVREAWLERQGWKVIKGETGTEVFEREIAKLSRAELVLLVVKLAIANDLPATYFSGYMRDETAISKAAELAEVDGLAIYREECKRLGVEPQVEDREYDEPVEPNESEGENDED